MQGMINFFRGSLSFTVTGAFPERFINLCAQAGIGFWDLAWQDSHTITLRVTRRDRRRLASLAERVQCTLTPGRPMGVPYFLSRFRRRYALLVGLGLSIATVCVLSQFILTVDVTGNETVTGAEILSQLKAQGLRPGSYGPDLDVKGLSNRALLHLPELSWMAINLHGTRAEVIVREKQPIPQVLDRSRPSHVVAAAPGVITGIEALEGQPTFREGDTVLTGEVLISGIMDIREPMWSEQDLGVRVVHARGQVWADTWRVLTAKIPLEARVKAYTGETETRFSLSILGTRLNFYRNSGISMERYDKITTTNSLVLPGGRVMPLALVVETCRGYDTAPAPLDRDAAQDMLEAALEAQLRALIGADGSVTGTDYAATVREGVLTVTLTAQCREQIGRVVEFEGELGVNPPGVPGSVSLPEGATKFD